MSILGYGNDSCKIGPFDRMMSQSKKELQSHLVGWLPYGSYGFHAIVVRRRRASDARPSASRPVAHSGASLLPAHKCLAGLYRRLVGVPRQHSPGVAGESEKDCRPWASMFASLARGLHCHRHQADREETRGGSPSADDPRNAGTSPEAAGTVSGRKHAQHRFYRAVEWNHAGAISQLDAQMSPRRSPPGSAGDGYVFAWMHVQLLLAAPRVEQTDASWRSNDAGYGRWAH